MKKLIYSLLSVFFVLACNTIKESTPNNEVNKKRFTKHVETFKNHFLKGFETNDLNLMLEMYADSLSWNGPIEGGVEWNKSDISAVFSNYLENFEDIELTKQLYFGGSVYSAQGEPSSDPDYVRVVGVWSTKHKESGVLTSTKWHSVMWFNEDGKVYRGTDWMDVSGIENQVKKGLENQ